MTATGMRLAVIDPQGNVIHAWDAAEVGRAALVSVAAQEARPPSITGRWPFRRKRHGNVDFEVAFNQAIGAFLQEVARK